MASRPSRVSRALVPGLLFALAATVAAVTPGRVASRQFDDGGEPPERVATREGGDAAKPSQGAATREWGDAAEPSQRAAAQQVTDASEILRRVDANLTFNTAWMRARMIIRYRAGDVRTLEFESWASGETRSFLEFTAPARDAGTRFLRIEDVMWYYLPRVGKSVRIQGHMLRQGLMGSDFSLGDATENPRLVEAYDAVIEADSTLDGRPVKVLYLTARTDDVSYASRRAWVDSERWVPLREERYARGGRLLVAVALDDVRQVGSRWYPFRIEVDNVLQTDTRTVLETLEIRLDVEVPERYFTLRHLEGGS